MLKSQKNKKIEEFCCNLFHTTYYTFWKKTVCRIPQEFESSFDDNISDQKCRDPFFISSRHVSIATSGEQSKYRPSVNLHTVYTSCMYIIQVW